jgi:hypothetical protein
MSHTCRTYAAALLVAAAIAALGALLMPTPASAMEAGTSADRYTSEGCGTPGGAQTPDRVFAEHVVGCATELDGVTVARLALLRDAVCEGLAAHVPAARMVDRLAGELGDRTQAVTLFTDANVWCGAGR